MQETFSGIVDLSRTGPISLYRQIYEQLRDAILSGRLAAGTGVPASRVMARQLSVSRNTVLAAVEQLAAEGYLEARQGVGTVVAVRLSEDLVRPERAEGAVRPPPHRVSRLAQRVAASGREMAPRGVPQPFQTGTPDIDAFPHDIWARLLRRVSRQLSRDAAAYAHTDGLPELRTTLSAYLRESRGVRAAPEQIFVTSSAQAGLDLLARAVVDPGGVAWIEEPGYLGARAALLGTGAEVVPVPVDAHGLKPGGAHPAPRLIYVTPSHQFPTGCMMPLARRLALLDLAGRTGAYVIEDDYDSEFQFRGRPVAALHGLDVAERVLYLGTFSKTMFPGLRVGYAVVPPGLAETLGRLQRNTGQIAPAAVQLAIAAFIEEGHYRAHLRRMRACYAERRDCLVAALRRHLGGAVAVEPPAGGMQLIAELQGEADDVGLAARLAGAGIEAQALSSYYLGPPAKRGLFLGFAAWSPEQIETQTALMARVLAASRPPSRAKA
ncbi:MAG: PLP-dependent aminotransferase family protein [Hyphomicrobiales bacterium]|nr:PLP-dependent aminotransferase family protein [Hyphomicrobiales bacterium]